MSSLSLSPLPLQSKGAAWSKIFGWYSNNLNPNALSDEEVSELLNLLYHKKVVVIKNVSWTDEEYISFARRLGRPVQFVDEEYRHPDHPEIFVVSNLKSEKGKKKIGMERVGYYWHSDSSFLKEPLPITMLHARQVPKSGGQTSFIDMQNVFDALPVTIQMRIHNKMARHEGKWRYLITEKDVGLSVQEILDRDEAELPSPTHPLVIVHPVTGRRALYLTEGITKRILGLEEVESTRLIQELVDRIQGDQSRLTHQWESGDLLIWDNRSLVHRAYPADSGQDRVMYRIGIHDRPFFCVEERK